MHITLTDVLSCPRCGPEHGLVLMADRVEDRRVQEGVLGCANCRERYAVRGGLADLRVAGQEPDWAEGDSEGLEGGVGGADGAVRLAALMGVDEGLGVALIVGEAVEHAAVVSSLVPELEVAVLGAGVDGWPEVAGVSRLAAGRGLTFRTGTLGAVALTGGAAVSLEGEGMRVLGRGGRLVLVGSAPGAAERLRTAGLAVLVDEAGVVVAQRA